LRGVKPTRNTSVEVLGLKGRLDWKVSDGNLVVKVLKVSIDEMPREYGYVFKLTQIGTSSSVAR